MIGVIRKYHPSFSCTHTKSILTLMNAEFHKVEYDSSSLGIVGKPGCLKRHKASVLYDIVIRALKSRITDTSNQVDVSNSS